MLFDTEKAERDSIVLREAPNVVGSGLVDLMLRWWRGKWQGI